MVTGRLIAAMLAAALALSACSDDGSSTASTSSTTSTTSTTTSTTSTSSSTNPPTSTSEPAGTDTAAVTPLLQTLVNRYDDSAEAILTDPRVAGNPDHALVLAYLALFPKGSSFASGTLKFWADEGAQGRFYRPGPGGKMYVSTIQSVNPRSDTEVVARVCTVTSVQVVDASGNPVESQGGVNGGEIVAVRVDGAWRLRDLTEAPADGCPRPGAP